MKTIYISFQNNYDPDSFTIRKIPFKELYGDFSFKIFEESQNILTGDNQQIIEHLSNSSDLIVDMYKAKNGKIYFLICVDKMLIIIERNDLRLLEKSFNPRKVLKIYFFKNVEKEFIKYINIQYNQSNKKFNIFDRVDFCSIIFNIDSMPKNEFWKVIKKSMLMYLFTKSYAKTLKNRIDEYLQNAQTLDYTNLQEIDKNSYLLLDTIYSVESTIKLAYYIKTQNLFVIKTYNYVNDESKCFQKREIDNLSNISHPLLPRFFGLTNYENKKSLAIEYINGNTLAYCIKKKKITQDNDKFDILMQVMVAIEYLHSKNYVYRDLKPSNVMIDLNKMAVLIDFDRMITGDGTECSRSLQNPYTAP